MLQLGFEVVVHDCDCGRVGEHGSVLGIFLPIFPNETMSDGIPQAGCPPVVREPSTPASAFLPPTALLHSRGAMPPSWLPPQHLSYRIAQSVQGPSPRFLFGLSLVCTHAVLRPRRLSKHGCLQLGAFAAWAWACRTPHPHDKMPPSSHAQPAPAIHPGQRA